MVAFDVGCNSELVSNFTNDTAALEQALQYYLSKDGLSQVTKSMPCQPLKALRAAARLFQGQQESNRRRAIFGVADDRGAGTASRLVREGLHDLWSAGAVVINLGLKSGFKEFHAGRFRGIRFAADQTGGEAVDFDDAPDGLREAIRRLRSRYSLFYTPPAASQAKSERSASNSHPTRQRATSMRWSAQEAGTLCHQSKVLVRVTLGKMAQ